MARSSAVPDHLLRYALASREINDRLVGAAAELGRALDALRATGPAEFGWVPALDEAVRRHGRGGAALADWVGAVGHAFQRADHAAPASGGAGHRLVDVDDALLGALGPGPTVLALVAILRELLDDHADQTPEERSAGVAAFASGLDDHQRLALVEAAPELVGPIDGMPWRMRVAANRILITRARDETAARLAEAERAGDLEALRELKTRLRTLDSFLAPRPDGLTGALAPRQFLLFDNAGRGRAAEVIGDLDEADHVAVLVPGMSNHLDNFSGLRENAYDLQRRADLLDGPDDHTATIAWLGYETPEAGTVASVAKAEQGAPALASFVAAVDRLGHLRTTVIAHSYGSVLTGLALRDHGLRPDNIAFIGSPGAGAQRVGDYHLPAGTDVYAARAPLDGVSYLERFGRDPSDPRFGARRFTTEPDRGVLLWHSSYFRRDSESLENLARITVDDDRGVRLMKPAPHDPVIRGVDDVQTVARELRELERRAIDEAQERLPAPGFVDGAIDGAQEDLAHLHAVADTMVDGAQYLADKVGDIAADARQVGDQVVEEGERRLVAVARHLDPRTWV